jgi:hypothetical protein
MKRNKYGVRTYNHPEKDHTRNYWIAESWRATGCGAHTDKKKLIPRKQKYKNLLAD